MRSTCALKSCLTRIDDTSPDAGLNGDCLHFETPVLNAGCESAQPSFPFLEALDLAPVALGRPALEKERLRLGLQLGGDGLAPLTAGIGLPV